MGVVLWIVIEGSKLVLVTFYLNLRVSFFKNEDYFFLLIFNYLIFMFILKIINIFESKAYFYCYGVFV